MKNFDRKEFQKLAKPVLKTDFYDEDSWECEEFHNYATETEEEDVYNGSELDYEDVMVALEDMIFRDETKQFPPALIKLLEYAYGVAIENKDGSRIHNYGTFFYDGRIGEQDFKKAAELYEIGASLGCPNSLCALGYIYYYGRTGEVNYEKAYMYFSKSAFRDNDATSLYKVGDMYKNGYYVQQDLVTAYKIYERSYEIFKSEEDEYDYDPSKAADAAFRVGECLLNGIGCDQDVMKALEYLQLAERGFVERVSKGEYFLRKMLKATVEKENEARQKLSEKLPDEDWAKGLTGYTSL